MSQNRTEKFTAKVLQWYQPTARPLPWKAIKNPYHIWLSEIILQQTRVEQGLPYYNRFVENYPTVVDLANAPEDDVLKLWQGLGYYSRARNLHASAKIIATTHKGVFPTTYKDILGLKGVGVYTAAAIASFAYGLPHAVVDGNVYRVLARYFGIETPIDSTVGKKEFATLAQVLLPTAEPAKYNQAIMDFGATHCTPKRPLCTTCLLQEDCQAYQNDKVQALPKKTKKIKHRKRYFYYLIIHTKDGIYLRQRGAGDVWQHLYDFPLIETTALYPQEYLIEELRQTKQWKKWFGETIVEVQEISKIYKQTLSHQKISTFFIEVFYKGNLNPIFAKEKEKYVLSEPKKLQTFAVPKMIADYLSAPSKQEGESQLKFF
jgi:A/G-specific adenine glycosylase